MSAVSGKNARSRAGPPGGSSSTTPSAPSSQTKFVRPSEASAGMATVSSQYRAPDRAAAAIDHPSSFFIRSKNALASGPRWSREADSYASSASRCRAFSFCGTSRITR